jgi:uncharacterized membrane protein
VKGLRATLAFVGLLPWIRGLAHRELHASLAGAIDAAFFSLCHHAPERTLLLGGDAMCVCSRCAGLYAGVFLAAVWPWRASPTTLRIVFPAGAALMMADILSQDLGLHAPWHPLRLATGAIVGFTATAWMLSEVLGSGRRGCHVNRREALAR